MSSTQSTIATGISIKSAFGEDLRRFQLKELTLKKLREELGALYQLHPFSFQVKYTDEDGDLITLSNDTELENLAKNASTGLLKLTVVAKPLLADKQSVKREIRLAKLKEKLAKKQEKGAVKKEEKTPQSEDKQDEQEVSKEERKQEKRAEKEAKKEEKKEKKVMKCARLASLAVVPRYAAVSGNNNGALTPVDFVFKKKDLSKPQGRFVKDVTFPDGSYVAPGTTFIKTWRFRNEGATAWPQGCSLLFLSKQGDNLSSPESVLITETVEAGKEIDVSVTLKAPEQSGRYVSYYRLCAPNKKKFGQRVRLLVQVGGESSSSSEKDEPVVANDEITFANQLAVLAQIGFTDKKKNIRLVKKFKGDLNRVVAKLVLNQNKISKIKHDI